MFRTRRIVRDQQLELLYLRLERKETRNGVGLRTEVDTVTRPVTETPPSLAKIVLVISNKEHPREVNFRYALHMELQV